MEVVWPTLGNPLGTHEQYQWGGQPEAKKVASEIASALSLPFTYDDTPAVDVVFLIDSTPNASDAVTELKARAEELTDVVSDANDNSRFAVVDYKGTDYGNPYVAHVAQDFTTDPTDVDDAIDALTVSGGNTTSMWGLPQSASGYSGVIEATGLEWRDYARKLVVLLSASRVNAGDPWDGDEEVTLISAADVDDALASEWDQQLYGVVYGDDWSVQDWVSQAAYHSGGDYRSVGSSGSAVDGMLLMTDEGLRSVDVSLAGSTLAKPGETLSFSASTRSVVDGSDVTYVWSVCEVSDEPIIASRSATVVTDAPICGIYQPTPGDEAEDEGATAEFEFTDVGLYRVGVSARVDPSDDPYWLGDPQLYWSQNELTVLVLGHATAAPSSSLIRRQVDGTSLTLALTSDVSTAQTVDYWELRDPSGTTVEGYLLPSDDQSVTVLDAASTDWTLVPVNEFGATPPRESVLATDLLVTEAGAGGDAVIEISGAVDDQLSDIASTSPAGPISLAGDYSSTWTADGWDIRYPMDDADASMEIDGGRWTATFDMGDDLDDDGYPMNSIVSWGLGEALADGGEITVQVDSEPVTFRLDSAILNQGILDPYGQAPDGIEVEIDDVDSLVPDIDVSYDGSYDGAYFPAWSEVDDPENYDWGQAGVSDIRVFIRDVEYVFSGTVVLDSVSAPTSTGADSLVLTIEGAPGDGSIEILRDFAQYGTVAFRIDDGEYNVVKLSASSAEAETYYPSP
ncbi:MAG: VWA domain-containing protein [Protaetiibacter sp.]